jgi:hypothetical protein
MQRLYPASQELAQGGGGEDGGDVSQRARASESHEEEEVKRI